MKPKKKTGFSVESPWSSDDNSPLISFKSMECYILKRHFVFHFTINLTGLPSEDIGPLRKSIPWLQEQDNGSRAGGAGSHQTRIQSEPWEVESARTPISSPNKKCKLVDNNWPDNKCIYVVFSKYCRQLKAFDRLYFKIASDF